MRAIDFFCGAGGLTRGLLNAGIEVRLGIDIDERCRATYETNNHPSQFLCADVQRLQTRDISEIIGDVPNDDLLLAACSPCQPFTQLKHNHTRGKDATLLHHFGRFIRELQPRQILLENVPGITKVPGNSTYKRFCRLLDELKYKYWESIVDAKDYGVPQTRRRYVMIALRKLQPPPLPKTHGPGLLAYQTVADAINHYPPIQAGETHTDVPNHAASKLSYINLTRIQNTPHDGGSRQAWPLELRLRCHTNGHRGHSDVYGRMWWHRPAPALTCRCDSLSNGRYGHPEQDRAISLREAASLQSFEDTYIFFGHSKDHLAAQVGNAVPVKLAESIGRHILALTNNTR